VGIEKRHVNWVRDADSRGFVEALDHEGLVKFVEQRRGARRVVRHRRQGLTAGGRAEGPGRAQEEGTPQGGKVRPLAANISRHEVRDRWAERWRHRNARGAVSIVRDGDDCIVGVEHRDDAERFWGELRARVQKVTLERHPEKTRRIECGRVAAARRQRRGQGKPATFDVLGVTPICSQTRKGTLTVRRQAIAKRRRKKRQEVKATLRQRRHGPIPQQGAGRRRVVVGQYRS
jgi:RNA-directed DNA polymerase